MREREKETRTHTNRIYINKYIYIYTRVPVTHGGHLKSLCLLSITLKRKLFSNQLGPFLTDGEGLIRVADVSAVKTQLENEVPVFFLRQHLDLVVLALEVARLKVRWSVRVRVRVMRGLVESGTQTATHAHKRTPTQNEARTRAKVMNIVFVHLQKQLNLGDLLEVV